MSAPSVVTVASARLAEQEWIIERAIKSYIELGDALTTIRDERLYREKYSNFEDYCQERWGFGRDYADRHITAANAVLTIVGTGLALPANEGQARELAKVPEPEREQVWRETLDRTGGKPTAAAVREVAAPPATEATPEPEQGTRPGRYSDGTPNDAQVPVDPAAVFPVAPRPEPRSTVRAPAQNSDDRRREVVETARRIAAHLVTNWRTDVLSIIAGIEAGETDLITNATIADLREAINLLEAKL